MTQRAPDSHVVFPLCAVLLSILTECAQNTVWQCDTLRKAREEDSKLCSATDDCGCNIVQHDSRTRLVCCCSTSWSDLCCCRTEQTQRTVTDEFECYANWAAAAQTELRQAFACKLTNSMHIKSVKVTTTSAKQTQYNLAFPHSIWSHTNSAPTVTLWKSQTCFRIAAVSVYSWVRGRHIR